MPACAEGISAVKAITLAQSQGQKVYTINKDNRDTALPRLTIGGDVGAEIRNAINAGKEVTFHESRISVDGWSGYGYIIIDPDTGAGAYLIEGSGNGGALFFLIGFVIITFLLSVSALALLGGPTVLGVIIVGLEVLSASQWVDKIKDAKSEQDLNDAAFMLVLGLLLRFMPTLDIPDLIVLKKGLEFILFWL